MLEIEYQPTNGESGLAMNSINQLELLRLRNDFDQLNRQVESYGQRLQRFEEHQRAELSSENELAIIMSEPEVATKQPPADETPATPPPLTQLPEYLLAKLNERAVIEPKLAASLEPAVPPPITSLAVKKETQNSGNFEMKLATYWFVRVGIVMLLTGLAFFGFYAYQHYFVHLGPAGKLSLIYAAGLALIGGGTWCQSDKANEKMRNFGNVVFAGGLSAIYFATYAAHHIEYLRVITSPLVDGALLLLWAVIVVWLADRKKSEVLALFAIGLSYYTSSITHIGEFTLACNLVLTLAAVGFLLRNRWVTLSFAGLIGTYVGYAFWRVYYDGESMVPLPEPQLWRAIAFLAGYWIIFSVAGFVSKAEELANKSRATFLTLNNIAFFGLAVLTFLPRNEGHFWMLCLGFGTVLLGTSWLARMLLTTELAVRNTLLTQAIILITLGFITKFTGMQLGLILAAETLVLLICGYRLDQRILRGGAYVTGLLSLAYTIADIPAFQTTSLVSASVVGVIFAISAIWVQRNTIVTAKEEADVRRIFWCLLSWMVWLVAAWQNVASVHRPVVFALLAALLTFGYPLLKLKELTVLAQAYLFISQIYWLSLRLGHVPLPGWILGIVIAATAGMAHWWQREEHLKFQDSTRSALQTLFGTMAVVLCLGWVQYEFTLAPRILWTAALAVGVTVYAWLTRWKPLAVAAQMLLLWLGLEFLAAFHNKSISCAYTLVPIFTLLVFSGFAWFLQRAKEEHDASLSALSRVYQGTSVLMSLLWIHEYLPAKSWFWVQALLGAVLFALSLYRTNNALLYLSLVFTAVGLFDYWFPTATPILYPVNMLAILALFGQQQALQRCGKSELEFKPLETAFIILGGLSAWLYLTKWVSLGTQGFYITASWAALAFVFFITGLILRDRRYRWFGLAVLGCAIGRVMFLDVWKLATIYRVLSFMALGVVLIVLGFIYTRYQDQIKKWL